MTSKPIGDQNAKMYILTIRDIREEDFGNYTCHATNSLGLDKHEIVVSGKPLPSSILPGVSTSKTEYKLRQINGSTNSGLISNFTDGKLNQLFQFESTISTMKESSTARYSYMTYQSSKLYFFYFQKYFHQSGVRCYGQNDCTDCKMQDSCNMLNLRYTDS